MTPAADVLAGARAPDLALFLPSFDRGGVERMVSQLARGLAGLGVAVDLVVGRRGAAYLDALPATVRVVELAALGERPLDAAAAYLRAARPPLLLSSKDDNNRLALAARDRAGVSTRIWFRAAIAESSRVAGQFFWQRWRSYRLMRRIYPRADGIIAVSADLARDVADITGVALADIHVAHNPVVTPELFDLAARPVAHPWLADGGAPVIMGVGRLARVKNFGVLIEAFARLRARRPCRLLILGEGRERAALERLAGRLGVAADVALPGFVDNPYAWLARARLFASSSRSEGSPNALTEALALGIPVVASNCLSGPREILQDGRYGRLVPVDDVAAMTDALAAALDETPDPEFLGQAARPYTLAGSAREYARILSLAAPGDMP